VIPKIFKRICKREFEVLDPTPIAMPVRFHRHQTLQEQIQMYTRNTLNKMAAANDQETFEEADDFDIGDDFEPVSEHEIEFNPKDEARFEQFAVSKIQETLKARQKSSGKAAPKAPAKPAEDVLEEE